MNTDTERFDWLEKTKSDLDYDEDFGASMAWWVHPRDRMFTASGPTARETVDAAMEKRR